MIRNLRTWIRTGLFQSSLELIKCIVCTLLIVGFGSTAKSQEYILQKLPLFGDRDDLLIKDLSIDSLGFVWFLHNSEVYRYDGYRSLSVMPTIQGYDAVNETPQKILVDKQNRLWIAGRQYVSYLDLKTWQLQQLPSDILPDSKNRSVVWIKQMADGAVITAYQNGWLVLYQNGKSSVIKTLYQLSIDDNNPILPQTATSWKGDYYIATSAGTLLVIHPNKGNTDTYLKLEGIRQSIFHLVALEDKLLLDVNEQGVFALNQFHTTEKIQISGFKFESHGKHLLVEGKNFHLYTDDTQAILLDNQFLPIQKLSHIKLRNQFATFKDADIILGTDRGIYSLYPKPTGISDMIPCTPSPNKSVRGIHIFADGSMLWGSYGGTGYRDAQGNCYDIHEIKNAYCMLPLNTDELLIGTEGGFFKTFNKNTRKVASFPYILSKEAQKKSVYSLPSYVLYLYDTPTHYLVGSTKGLWKLDKKTRILSPIDIWVDQILLPTLEVKHIQPGPLRGQWLLSTQLGLICIDEHGQGTTWYPKQGSTGVYKSALCHDTLWVATQAKGLVALSPSGEYLRSWTKADGLSDNTVFSLEIVNDLKVVGTADGLSCIENGQIWHLDEKAGIPHPEFNSGASIWDPIHQKVYMGGIKGYTVINTKTFRMKPAPEKQYVTEIHVAAPTPPYTKKIFTLPYTSDSVVTLRPQESLMALFIGTPLSHRSNSPISYRIKNSAWQVLSAGQFISLIESPPGEYPIDFTSSKTITPTSVATISVVKMPSFHETWWFHTLVVIAIALLITSWYRYKIEKITREQAIRNRIADDLHDEVGGLLTGISMQVELLKLTNQHSPHQKNISRLSALSKEVLSSMNDVVWSLNSKNDSWQNLLDKLTDFSKKLFEPTNTHFSMDIIGTIPDKLTQEERQTLYLFIREALHNACKHAQANIVVLRFIFQQQITVAIVDNGQGFENSQKSNGNGLQTMKKRAQALGTEVSINSTTTGTTIQIRFTPKR